MTWRTALEIGGSSFAGHEDYRRLRGIPWVSARLRAPSGHDGTHPWDHEQ